jgi:DMSO/TMAO reductase YedYZ molybdopterin-dependent catalytic subunit
MATSWVHRRDLLKLFGAGSAALVLGRVNPAGAQVSSQAAGPLPAFTGPEANPYWNGVNPFVTYPQKLPLLRLTDRGIQLETPRQYFDRAFTPNPAFYVRYHLELIPNSVALGPWRLHLEGNFDKPMQLSFEELVRTFRRFRSPRSISARATPGAASSPASPAGSGATAPWATRCGPACV